MKALEFQGSLRDDATLVVPQPIANLVPRDRPLRVLLLVPENEDGEEWEELAASDFFQGYSASDAIYDDLPAR